MKARGTIINLAIATRMGIPILQGIDLSEAKFVIDGHIERAESITIGDSPACTILLEGDEDAAYQQKYYSDIIDAQVDLMARTLVCGLTRVATLQCNSADGNAEVPVDGRTYGHHDISHGSQDIYSRCPVVEIVT